MTSCALHQGTRQLVSWNLGSSLLAASVQDECVKRHVMYPGLQETLKSCKYPWYVVTSRAKHRTLKLIDALLDMQWPEDSPRLYSKMLPPNEKKIETLQ